MYATPYTDELVAIAGAGICCQWKPQEIFTMVARHAQTGNAEREPRLYALRSLSQAGILAADTHPKIEGYTPHTPFIYDWTLKEWKDKISRSNLAL